MNITHLRSIDMARQMPMVPVDAVQGDGNTRILKLRLLENGTEWAVPETVTGAVAFRKSDGTKGLYDTLPDGTKAVTVEGSTVSAVLAPQVLTCPGDVTLSVVFHDEKLNQLATSHIPIRVAANPAAGQTVSNDYYYYSTMADISKAMDTAIEALDAKTRDFLAKAEEALETVHDTATEAAPAIVCEAVGEVISVADAADRPLEGLRIYGKTVQNGTPTPDAPVPLKSVGESIGVTVAGKNLLPCAERTEVKNGVTFAGNADGITANGTATAQCYFLVDTFVPSVSGKYIVSGCPSGGNINQYNVQVERNSASVCNEFGSGAVVDLEAGGSYKFYAVVRIGYTANNLTFKPMIRLASVTDATYEPYKEVQTLAASAEGGLHGIGEVKDEIDFAKGVRIRRLKKIVLNGSEGWKNFGSDGVAFCFNDYDLARASDYRTVSAVMCDCLQSVSHNDCMRGVVKNSICLVADQNAIGVCIDGIESVDALKVYLNEHPMGVVAMLLAPAEIPLTAEELAAFAVARSNKPNTTVINDSSADMKLTYNADTKLYIDQKLAAISAALLNK